MANSEEEKFQCNVMKALGTMGYIGLPTGKQSTIDEIIVGINDCWKILVLFEFKYELSVLPEGGRQRRTVAEKSQVNCFQSPWREKLYFIVATRDNNYIVLDVIGLTTISNEINDGRSTINFPLGWEDTVQNQINHGNIIIVDDFDKLISELLKLLR